MGGAKGLRCFRTHWISSGKVNFVLFFHKIILVFCGTFPYNRDNILKGDFDNV